MFDQARMLNPKLINPFTLPSVLLHERLLLPSKPCIYFAIDFDGQIKYIGQSINLKARWALHHKYPELQKIAGIWISYLHINDPSLLSQVEAALIDRFAPPLNKVRPFWRDGSPIRSGGLRNKIKQFLESRNLSAYQFIKDTGIAPATGYKLAKKPSYLPSIRVLEAICDAYEVQPGELLEWIPGGAVGSNVNITTIK